MASGVLAASLLSTTGVARADAVATLRTFVKDVQTGRASFTQTVTSPDGKKTRKSTGTLEFQRPNKFRFAYAGPTEQLIVGDGKQVWLYDTDLNQVTVRPMNDTIGASPAALLAGGSLDKDFTLSNVTAGSSSAATATSTPSQATSSLEWVEALPRHKEGQFQSVRVGFNKKNGQLAALEILDSFGQRSRLDFAQFESKVALPATRFQFTPPKGADVLNQP
ncbi:MAG: outer membrane lipoprotein chaperone LolA [Aquabacterium sp.]|uniref:outer membrane lipoprotein chaperone LolA n=1 Tax=Aquabacterium sp. TaxID=1872578 RepID=UPI0025BF09ED|nr:outer membrane lipoprotein chaperone LolA [Aquabacterium sp.]MBI3384341.1 outer membrane lipoprotein chaperone LolA [Aquabacterium sp.]